MSEKKILVPNIGDFKNVEVIEVLVKSGQQIKKNDPLITLESDKSSVEVPSTVEGKIKKIIVKVGDKVSEGSEILFLDVVGEKHESVKAIKVKEDLPSKKIIENIPKETAPAVQKISKDGVSPASPKVRKFARELGADIVQISGSQRAGRVTEDDVKKFVRSQVSVNNGKVEKKVYKDEYPHEAFGETEKKDLPRVKKISGPQLVRSWTEIPHVTQHDEIDITEMEQFRTTLIDNYTGERIRISPLAFITRAVVNALKEYPNFNSSIDSENNKLIFKKYYHVGFAVDTPHGLMVPKIRNVDQLGLMEIYEELRRVSKQCKELKIDKKEFFGGSMTISSLGGIGGNFFTPIINPPEVAILGVGKTFDKIKKVNGQFIVRKMLPISLSYDHRVIDGAEGARFCVHLSKSLGKDFAFKLAV
tara:strand:- start:1500 stop:2753 length:1254 start_codon:yes stop_codon:yes gene_type:complete